MKATTNLFGNQFGKNRKRRTSAVLRAAVEALEGRTLLSFGDHGTVVTPFSGSLNDSASSVLVQPNGKVVEVGDSTGEVALARYSASGNLDPTFGNGGKVTTIFPYNYAQSPSAALDGNQNILVVATLQNNITYNQTSMLARYLPNGQLDRTFGNGGEVSVLAGVNSAAYVTALQNGEIAVAAGLYNPNTSTESFIMEEYQANGALDTSFGTNGRVTTVVGGLDGPGGVNGIALQGNDIILAGNGSAGVNLVVARYTAAGVLDPSFATGGLATYPVPANAINSGMALAADGAIFITGNAYVSSLTTPSDNAFVTQLNPSGHLDTAYGTGGTATLQGFYINGIAIQPDGKAAVAVTTASNLDALTQQAGAARFTKAGALDPTFGTGGLVISTFTTSDAANAIALRPAGAGTNVLIGGSSFDPATGEDFLLARYTASGVVDPSFGNDGFQTTNFVGPVSSVAVSTAPDGHGGTLVGGQAGSAWGFAPALTANGDLCVADYLPDGQLNTAFGDDGTVQVTFNSFYYPTNGGYIAVQKDGKILLAGTSIQPGTTNYDIVMARLLPDGALDPSFGVGGKVTTYSGANYTDMGLSGGIVIQPDGKILAAGYTENYGGYPYADAGVVIRYNTDGSLDTTFGSGGRETFATNWNYPSRTTAIALEPNGEIMVGGFITNPTTYVADYFLQKLQANGAPDTTFAPAGQILTDFTGSSFTNGFQPGGLLLEPDGNILVGGTTYDPTTYQSYMTVAEFTAAGTPDASFGTGGQATVGFPGNPSDASVYLGNIALLPNGKILLVGSYSVFDPTTYAQTIGDIALAKLTPAGKLDTSFGTDGTVLTSFSQGFVSAFAVQVQSNGQFVVVGFEQDADTDLTNFALADYFANGTQPNGVVIGAAFNDVNGDGIQDDGAGLAGI